MMAKAVARQWHLPLLRLDMGRVFGEMVGASEANMRQAMKVAESVAPCVLWLDELEKGLAGSASSGRSDGGTAARVLATFLTWMQEKQSPVFVVATSNEVRQLPPELLRKGRFDEIFFVDLPDAQSRKSIFEIHLKKRGQEPNRFDLQQLVELTDGFSGSEIEQAIVSGLYTAFSAKKELTTEILIDEIKLTTPISITMSERIAWLREWAKDRTVSAH